MSNHTYFKTLNSKGFDSSYIDAVKRHSRQLKINEIPIILSLKHLSVLADMSYLDLYALVYRKINPYRIFSIRKKNGGKRWICVPCPSLMKVQKWINKNILYSHFAKTKVSKNATAYVQGEGIFRNAEKHHDSLDLIKVDVTRFFESISERQVFHVFLSFGYKPFVAFILTRLCTRTISRLHDSRVRTDKKRWTSTNIYKFKGYTTKGYDIFGFFDFGDDPEGWGLIEPFQKVGHLPQGAPTSPALANLVCYGLDERLMSIATNHDLIYTRYADDIVMSGDIKSRDFATLIIRCVSKELRIEGFKVNFQKTRYCPSGSRQVITGIVINDTQQLRVPREYKEKIKQEIYYLNKFGIEGHCQKIGVKNPLAYLMRLEGRIRYVGTIEGQKNDAVMQSFLNAVPQFSSLKKYYL